MGFKNSIKLFVALQSTLLLLMTIIFIMLHIPLAIILILLLFGLGILFGLVYKIVRPLEEIEQELDRCIQMDNDKADILEGLLGDNVLGEKIEVFVKQCVEQKTRENAAEIFGKQAELTALQSQINPHFLYNTLESIRGQALIDGNEEIAKMMEALASFFRYSISRKGSLVTLRDELMNIKNYMMIQRYRFNNRFSLEIFIDEEDEAAYDYLIPRLIVQPIVENAIYHGLEERLEGGKVEIEVILTERNLIVTVSDNGQGMNAASLWKINDRLKYPDKYISEQAEKLQFNTGIGLPNIHKRIQLLFGEEYGLQVYSTLNQGTDVEITIPANYERSTHQL